MRANVANVLTYDIPPQTRTCMYFRGLLNPEPETDLL